MTSILGTRLATGGLGSGTAPSLPSAYAAPGCGQTRRPSMVWEHPEPLSVTIAPLTVVLVSLVLASTLYWLYAWACVLRFRANGRRPAVGPLPPVTVLKPLCGAHPGLYESLRSFCEQDYPELQVVFGVRQAADPAVEVVHRLMHEYR